MFIRSLLAHERAPDGLGDVVHNVVPESRSLEHAPLTCPRLPFPSRREALPGTLVRTRWKRADRYPCGPAVHQPDEHYQPSFSVAQRSRDRAHRLIVDRLRPSSALASVLVVGFWSARRRKVLARLRKKARGTATKAPLTGTRVSRRTTSALTVMASSFRWPGAFRAATPCAWRRSPRTARGSPPHKRGALRCSPGCRRLERLRSSPPAMGSPAQTS